MPDITPRLRWQPGRRFSYQERRHQRAGASSSIIASPATCKPRKRILRISRMNTPDIPAPLPLPGANSARVLVRCLTYLRPYWRMTLGAYMTLAGINVLTLAIPQFIRWIVDRGIGAKNTAL